MPRWWKPLHPVPSDEDPDDREQAAATTGGAAGATRSPATARTVACSGGRRLARASGPGPDARAPRRSTPLRARGDPAASAIHGSSPSRHRGPSQEPHANAAAADGGIQAPTGAPQTVTWSRISSRVAGPIPLTSIRLLDRGERPVLIPVLDDGGRQHLADARTAPPARSRRGRVDVDQAARSEPGAAPPGTPAAGGAGLRHEDLGSVGERRREVQRG